MSPFRVWWIYIVLSSIPGIAMLAVGCAGARADTAEHAIRWNTAHILPTLDEMSAEIELVLFDIGGVLGTNGWDREQRDSAVEQFQLDPTEFQYRHEETVSTLEAGRITLDDYLDVTVFYEPRSFDRHTFKDFMFAQSKPWPDCISVARDLAALGGVRLATLNNESAELNHYRIRLFGLHSIFPAFFTSCWLGSRKPMRVTYEKVLGMTEADPTRTVFIDDRTQNLAPAAALGMQTIRFESAQQLRRALRQYLSAANP